MKVDDISIKPTPEFIMLSQYDMNGVKHIITIKREDLKALTDILNKEIN